MAEEPAAFYDAAYRRSKGYKRDHHHAWWAHLWRFAAEQVRDDDRVLDIGCGPGHLAALLHERTSALADGYLGVDFSIVAIRQARARVPSFHFERATLPSAMASLVAEHRPTVVVACEFLEHVEQDLQTLRAVPASIRVVATLPRHMSPGHVRCFRGPGSVGKRYSSVLRLQSVPALGRKHWGLIGTRR